MIANLKRSLISKLAAGVSLAMGLLMIASSTALASTPGFAVPEDTALRIRLDDTIRSAQRSLTRMNTVMHVYTGASPQIEMSGRIKGSTGMMLRFDHLVMPDGRRTPIHYRNY